MKFSLWPDPGSSTEEQLDLARYADTTGWYGVWFADHYMPNTGDESLKPGDRHECWGLIPAAAAVTSNVRVGPLVSPTSVHHPAVLANRAATIDHISNGRMVLGLGAGWQINEHHAYGIDLEEPGPRVTRFGEAIQIIRSLLAEDRTTFAGDVYSLTDAPSDPSPVQDPLPILVGSSGKRMLSFVARFADEWNAWGTPDLAIEKRAKLVAACEREGIDPGSKATNVNAMLVLSDDAATVDAALSGPMGSVTIAGSADHLVEQLARYEEAGFDEFVLPLFDVGDSVAERMDITARLKEQVFDQL